MRAIYFIEIPTLCFYISPLLHVRSFHSIFTCTSNIILVNASARSIRSIHPSQCWPNIIIFVLRQPMGRFRSNSLVARFPSFQEYRVKFSTQFCSTLYMSLLYLLICTRLLHFEWREPRPSWLTSRHAFMGYIIRLKLKARKVVFVEW